MMTESFRVFYAFPPLHPARAHETAHNRLRRSLLAGFEYRTVTDEVYERSDGVDVEIEFTLTSKPPRVQTNLAFNSFFPTACDLARV
jgi:hypothetical protein